MKTVNRARTIRIAMPAAVFACAGLVAGAGRWMREAPDPVVPPSATARTPAPSDINARFAHESPQVAAMRATASAGRRILYPQDRYPVLTLPDGSRQAVRSVLNVTRPMRFGDYLWNDAGVPAGPAWIRIDLTRQTLSIFRAGHEIGSTVILYGTDGKPTPTGLFPVLEKAVRHRSTLYDAEMPYMLRLTGDGVAVHASQVRSGSATHGCIGVPEAFARLVFAQIRRGDPVAITRSARA